MPCLCQASLLSFRAASGFLGSTCVQVTESVPASPDWTDIAPKVLRPQLFERRDLVNRRHMENGTDRDAMRLGTCLADHVCAIAASRRCRESSRRTGCVAAAGNTSHANRRFLGLTELGRQARGLRTFNQLDMKLLSCPKALSPLNTKTRS